MKNSRHDIRDKVSGRYCTDDDGYDSCLAQKRYGPAAIANEKFKKRFHKRKSQSLVGLGESEFPRGQALRDGQHRAELAQTS